MPFKTPEQQKEYYQKIKKELVNPKVLELNVDVVSHIPNGIMQHIQKQLGIQIGWNQTITRL